MTFEERIQLKNEILEILKNYNNILRLSKNTSFYRIYSKQNFIDALNDDQLLFNKYKQYISEFRTENEALYCLMHNDDFSNHLCPICSNVCLFYSNKKKK